MPCRQFIWEVYENLCQSAGTSEAGQTVRVYM